MIQKKYKNVDLFLFTSMQEHCQYFDSYPVFTNASGEEVELDINTIDFSLTQARDHFASDDDYKPRFDYWYANTDPETKEKSIVLVLLMPYYNPTMLELVTMVGHEYGHLVDANEVQNATAPYDTQEGYEQEERKGIWFENFVQDVYNMAILYKVMIGDFNYETSQRQNNATIKENKDGE